MKPFINQIDHREDLTHYGEDELSLRVFNDEYFYENRHHHGLMNLLHEQFIFTYGQAKTLADDLQNDREY